MYASARMAGLPTDILYISEARNRLYRELRYASHGLRRHHVMLILRHPGTGYRATQVLVMNNIVYIVGAIVIVLVVLSVLGLR